MFSPLEKKVLSMLIDFGTDLPHFLDTVPTPERIAAVAILALRFPSIPASVAGALIANPLSVVLAYPKDVPACVCPEGPEGLPKIDLSEFAAQFADASQANARDREQELEDAQEAPCTTPSGMTSMEYLASLSDEELAARLSAVGELARNARSMGLSDSEIGKVLGEFGLDWPAGSGDFHGWK